MAKFCSNCGKELNENADICLKCGVLVDNKCKEDTKKKKKFPVWAVVLIVLGCISIIPILVFLLVGLFTYNIVRTVPSEEIDSYVEDFAEEFEDEVKSYVDEYKSNTIVEGRGVVGDTLEIDNMEVTLIETKTFKSIGENVLDAGKEYLVFVFDIKNNGDSGKLVSYLNFNGVVDDDDIMSSFLMEKVEGLSNLNRNIEPGEIARGYVAFEVDEDFAEFDLHYQRYITNSEIIFSVSNNSEVSEEA